METHAPEKSIDMQTSAAPLVPLASGTSLRRRYTVRSVLFADDCSITYGGFDFKARQPVCIVEFYPRVLAMRAFESGTVSPKNKDCGALYFLGSEAFLHQHQALTQAIGSPNIISVFDAFFENGTAYAVTEQPEGLSLYEYLQLRNAPIRPGELIYIGNALADAMLIVHSLSQMHCDISAQRILICTDGTIKFSGFSAAHMTVRRGHDVADMEPADDILALGQALYTAFTGQSPVQNAPQTIAHALPESLASLFEQMLSTQSALRFASVFDLRYAMNNTEIQPERPKLSAADIEAFHRMRQDAERRRTIGAVSGDAIQKSIVAGNGGNPPQKQTDPIPERTARRLTLCLSMLIVALIIALIVLLVTR